MSEENDFKMRVLVGQDTASVTIKIWVIWLVRNDNYQSTVFV